MDNYQVWPMLSCFSWMFSITRRREKKCKNKKTSEGNSKIVPGSSSTGMRSAGLRKRKNYLKKWKEKTRDKKHNFLFIPIDRNCCEPSTWNTTRSLIINQIDRFFSRRSYQASFKEYHAIHTTTWRFDYFK